MSASTPYERRALTQAEFVNMAMRDPIDTLKEINNSYRCNNVVPEALDYIVKRTQMLRDQGKLEHLAADILLHIRQMFDGWYDERKEHGHGD